MWLVIKTFFFQKNFFLFYFLWFVFLFLKDICYTPEQLDLYLFLQQQQRYPFRRIQQQLYQDNYTLTFEHQNICEDCGNVGRECCDSSGSNEVEDDGNEEKEEGKEEKDEEEEEKENDENEEAAPQLQLKNGL